jgi:hypothetical protein
MRDNDSLPHDDGGRVQADDIRWSLTPDDRHEDLNLLLLEDEDVLAYAAELRHDLRTVRTLLSEALTVIQRHHVQLRRYKRRVTDLVDALRRARADAAALRAQLAACRGRAA